MPNCIGSLQPFGRRSYAARSTTSISPLVRQRATHAVEQKLHLALGDRSQRKPSARLEPTGAPVQRTEQRLERQRRILDGERSVSSALVERLQDQRVRFTRTLPDLGTRLGAELRRIREDEARPE